MAALCHLSGSLRITVPRNLTAGRTDLLPRSGSQEQRFFDDEQTCLQFSQSLKEVKLHP